MRHFIKKTGKRFSISAVALMIASVTMAACTSTAVNDNRQNNKAAIETTQKPIAAGDKITEKTPETAANAQTNQTDGLPVFKTGEDYKSSVRVKMLKAGWKPARTENADKCMDGNTRCEDFPEMENCAGSGQGNCKFRWQRDKKIVAIFTVDDPPFYKSSEFEAPAAPNSPQNAADKSWEPFWTSFSAAINAKNQTDLKKMMSDDFFDGGGGGTASQWLKAMERNNMWSIYQQIVAAGTKADECAIPCRSTKDGYLVFEYRNGRWLWTELGGEGRE